MFNYDYVDCSPAARQYCGDCFRTHISREEIIKRAKASKKVRSAGECNFGLRKPGVCINFNGGVQLCVVMDEKGENITQVFVDHPRLGEI